MDTILLQINNDKAYKLIENLEALNIVKVLEKGGKIISSRKKNVSKPSEFEGAISKKAANLIIADIEKNREEWERNI